MALIYYGMAILSLVGAGAIVVWIRKSDEGWTTGIVIMVIVLLILGISMFGVALVN